MDSKRHPHLPLKTFLRLSQIFCLLPATVGLALLLAGCATTPGRPEAASTNDGLIRRYFDEWANHNDVKVADELIASNVILHHPHVTVSGLDAYKQSMAMFHTAFPDLHFAIEDELTAGDRVVVRWTMTGTQRGVYQGQPGSNRKVTVAGMSWFRIEKDRIQEIWVTMDRLGFLQQLGLMPASK